MVISLLSGLIPDIAGAKLIECRQHRYIASNGRFILAIGTSEQSLLLDMTSELLSGAEANLFQALWAIRGQPATITVEAEAIPQINCLDEHGFIGAFGVLIELLKVAEGLGFDGESARGFILSIFTSGQVSRYLTHYAD
jgi:hypothetical protein